MITIEDLYAEFNKRPVGSKFITASDRHTIELMEDVYKIVISKRGHKLASTDVMIDIKKKDSFSGFFGTETQFMWHLENDEDVNILIDKLEKIPNASAKTGPYEFSRRSTYVKKVGTSMAMSGNFVNAARVLEVVVVDDKGRLIKELTNQGKDAWFNISINAQTMAASSGFGAMPSRGEWHILYNTEKWWPIDMEKNRATSILRFTEGKFLTMHDKFVLDLAVKIFHGG